MANYGEEISTISLGSIIGGALNAIVEAQSQAADTTVQFIESVGFTEVKDGKENKLTPVYVSFDYAIKDDENKNREVSMKVPLLTMVPIPFIRIDSADIDFNVKINSVEETKTSQENKVSGSTQANANYKGFRFNAGIKLNASISNQKKSSSSDTVKRDYSLNVHVHAVQDDMPAGVERLLSILENSEPLAKDEKKKSETSGAVG
jgi:hypothetical protein